MKTYKGWELLDKIPDGWRIDKTVGSPLHGYEFITNGKSVVNGQKRALLNLHLRKKHVPDEVNTPKKIYSPAVESKKFSYPDGYAKTINELARARFKESLLKDILADLMVCEIEGWSKSDYINDLKNLINSIRLDG